MIRPLLNNEFAPITFNVGFVETAFSTLCDAFKEWSKEIEGEHPGLRTDFTPLSVPFHSALLSLEPLTTPLDRYLIVETKSNWTAIFANGLRVSDVTSPTSYLPRILKCRGLEVGHEPDASKSIRKDLIRMWGSTVFTLYGSTDTDWLNRVRDLRVSNDAGGWSFHESGEPQFFEEAKAYSKRRIPDRFTFEMLERYCRALGIEPNQDDFYGPKSCAIRRTGRRHQGDLNMSIAEAKSHLSL
jgi:hypothetical protein